VTVCLFTRITIYSQTRRVSVILTTECKGPQSLLPAIIAFLSLGRSDGSIVTFGKVSHGRTAEGVACSHMRPLLTQALEMQTEHDWYHFPD
jgi:hypothetical protein